MQLLFFFDIIFYSILIIITMNKELLKRIDIKNDIVKHLTIDKLKSIK